LNRFRTENSDLMLLYVLYKLERCSKCYRARYTRSSLRAPWQKPILYTTHVTHQNTHRNTFLEQMSSYQLSFINHIAHNSIHNILTSPYNFVLGSKHLMILSFIFSRSNFTLWAQWFESQPKAFNFGLLFTV